MSMLSLKSRLDEAHAKRAKGEGGFTLIELLVVVVIIGILVAIAIPLYLNYRKGAAEKSVQSDVRAAVSAVEQCIGENNNALPIAAANTTKGATVTLTCGTGTGAPTEKMTSGDSNLISYSPDSGSTTTYTIIGHNDDTQFTYSSASGKTEKTAYTPTK